MIWTHLGPEWLRETSVGLPNGPLEVLNHRLGEGKFLSLVQHVLRLQLVLHHELSQIAHYFGGGSHLDDVAQQLIGLESKSISNSSLMEDEESSPARRLF